MILYCTPVTFTGEFHVPAGTLTLQIKLYAVAPLVDLQYTVAEEPVLLIVPNWFTSGTDVQLETTAVVENVPEVENADKPIEPQFD